MLNSSKPKKQAQTPKTVRDARIASKKNRDAYIDLIEAVLQRLDKKRKFSKRMESLLGSRPYNGKPLASDAFARWYLQQEMIRHFRQHQKHNPDQRFFFLTFLSDEFRTTKREPGVWVKRLRVKTDKVLRGLCKDHGAIGAVAMIECAWLTNAVDERTGMYQWHSHALLWAEKDFDRAAAKKSLEALTNWRCVSGVTPITIKELTPKKGSAAYWAYYMCKLPVDAINVVERTDGGLKIRKTKKGYRPDVQLRLFEALSQIPLQELMFSVEDGKFIRDPVMRATRNAKRVHRSDLKPRDVIKARQWFKVLWQGSRADHPKGWFIAM